MNPRKAAGKAAHFFIELGLYFIVQEPRGEIRSATRNAFGKGRVVGARRRSRKRPGSLHLPASESPLPGDTRARHRLRSKGRICQLWISQKWFSWADLLQHRYQLVNILFAVHFGSAPEHFMIAQLQAGQDVFLRAFISDQISGSAAHHHKFVEERELF
jgi:hypothetical protein